MNLTKITANNFYSFKKLELDLSTLKGIVRVNGVNKDSGGSNGSGKSSVFEAVVWGLFNKSIRKSTEESLVNFHTGKDCEVCVEIKKDKVGDIKIVRSKRPTSLNFFINGVNCNKDNSTETQKYIEEVLETDYKSFLASVVFGQHSDVSFLEASSEDKRNIIKNCFDLDEFFSKRDSVKELKSLCSADLKAWNTILTSLESDKAKIESVLTGKKYTYIELAPLKDILAAESNLATIKSRIKSEEDYIREIKDKIKKLDSLIADGVHESTKKCPVCSSSYTKCQSQQDLDNYLKDKEKAEAALMIETSILHDLKAKAADLKPTMSSSEWAKYNDKNNLVLSYKDQDTKLKEIELKISELKAKIAEFTIKLEVWKFWELAFSEKGVVRYIIRNVLDYFNLKSNEYLSILTNNAFSIKFSDDLTETISNNGSETKYISLSGGEKRKLNLAIMLALQDLSSKISHTDCNLIFFDEVCDNIDGLGIQAIHNLLETLRIHNPDKVLLLITHNNYLQELLADTSEILVIKEKGISKIHHGN
jgi:DNA repair exonuclease SbcCD ATPase subunit